MTAVIGILNKNGVAIAADSAVTRTRGSRGTKVTKNGNKMIRLSNAVPISVMVTGNSDFLRIPWDLIIRCYRRERGNVEHRTVEEAAHDLFRYLAHQSVFWEERIWMHWVQMNMDLLAKKIRLGFDNEDERDDEDMLRRPAAYRKKFYKTLHHENKEALKGGRCPQFEDYPGDRFHELVEDMLEKCFGMNDFPMLFRHDFERVLLTCLTTRNEGDASAELIFSGYGKDQIYPSLVPVIVCEGFDAHVNYHIRPEEIVCIGDDRPVAICPFAQRDVARAILRGIHRDWSYDMERFTTNLLNPQQYVDDEDTDAYVDVSEIMQDFKADDLVRKDYREGMRFLNGNQRKWEQVMEQADLASLASLAESLIDLTGFQRILTFQQEGVGGPVDLAVISRNEGFTWLSRKSWYHHKDYGGQYGRFGV